MSELILNEKDLGCTLFLFRNGLLKARAGFLSGLLSSGGKQHMFKCALFYFNNSAFSGLCVSAVANYCQAKNWLPAQINSFF